MKELLLFIIKNLVSNPDAVSIEEIKNENEILLKISVDAQDIGKIIGKQGRIANSIRTIMKSAAARDGVSVNVEILG